MLLPTTVAEKEQQAARRRAERPTAIWPSFLWLTLFQVLTCLQPVSYTHLDVYKRQPLPLTQR